MSYRWGGLPKAIQDAVDRIEEHFRGMVFLGPLREEPKPVYPVPDHISLSDFGKRGENTAALLHANEMIVCLTPEDFQKKLERIQRKREEFQAEPSVQEDVIDYDIEYDIEDFIPVPQMSLKQAVSEWLNYLDLAEEVETVDKGALGHQLKIRTRGSSVSDDLMHVGVGISQVLPILVAALLAPEGSSLLLEQPELHLHPSVQTKLADFFLSLTMMGKQCIIETHSEHILNRLRLRRVQFKETPFNPTQHICIYFARRGNDESLFEEISFDENEVITNWPEGFFDQFQQDQDEILRAKAEGTKSQLRQQERMSVEELIKKCECETIEFKSTLRWNKEANRDDDKIKQEVIKTIAAFLNTRGGTLLVGVNDKGIPVGFKLDHFENEDKTRQFLRNLVKERIGAQFTTCYEVSFKILSGETILRVHCQQSEVPAHVDGNLLYIRSGASSEALPGDQIYSYVSSHFPRYRPANKIE